MLKDKQNYTKALLEKLIQILRIQILKKSNLVLLHKI